MNEYIVIYNLGEYHREWEQRLWLENNKGERGDSEWLWFLFLSFFFFGHTGVFRTQGLELAGSTLLLEPHP
jgi:hypothetical protein